MNIQEKRNIFNKYKTIDREIERLIDERTKWVSKAERITPSYLEGTKSNSVNSKIETAIEHIQEIEELLTYKIDEQIKLQKYIESCIDELDNEKHKTILKYKYINLYTFEQIAEKMDYCDARYVVRIHNKALSKVPLNYHEK